jgi:hypothetical protein
MQAGEEVFHGRAVRKAKTGTRYRCRQLRRGRAMLVTQNPKWKSRVLRNVQLRRPGIAIEMGCE